MAFGIALVTFFCVLGTVVTVLVLSDCFTVTPLCLVAFDRVLVTFYSVLVTFGCVLGTLSVF